MLVINTRNPFAQYFIAGINKLFPCNSDSKHFKPLWAKRQKTGDYAGVYITKEKTNFHKTFIDEIQNVIIIIEHNSTVIQTY